MTDDRTVTADEARFLGSEQWYRITGSSIPQDYTMALNFINEQEKKLERMRRAFELYFGITP